ncbi:MAG: hypothetical protein QM767_21460 [Anaeromyxobacter sp.]
MEATRTLGSAQAAEVDGRSAFVLCHPRDRNDATFRYLRVVERALAMAGYRCRGIVESLESVRDGDLVFTISCIYALKVLLSRKRVKLVHWFQGVEPEERRFLHGGVKGVLQGWLWSLLERWTLRRATLPLFVSQEMAEHYGCKYGFRGEHFVMPCYNADLDPQAFEDKYGALRLVYAGSMHPWQRVGDVVEVYRELKRSVPDVTLTILTRELEQARALCARRGVPEVQVRSVPADRVAAELRPFSFGFILRGEMAINRVSTPTKLSSYMAAGVIPVLTSATPALVRAVQSTTFRIAVGADAPTAETADEIRKLYWTGIRPEQVLRDYRAVFGDLFDDETNAVTLCGLLRRLCS